MAASANQPARARVMEKKVSVGYRCISAVARTQLICFSCCRLVFFHIGGFRLRATFAAQSVQYPIEKKKKTQSDNEQTDA